ncbi:MAG: hypothetical protein KFH87_07745 [Bacteroidetes bacterium]|nr:hypothetical protein [Bacteroidota bacterium]
MAQLETNETIAELRDFFDRNGYVRFRDEYRAETEGSAFYKKGDELRLVARSKRELARIRRLLKAAGFRPGSPYAQGHNYRQPVYGQEEVTRFLELISKRRSGHRKSGNR